MKRCTARGNNHSDFVSPENLMAISQMGIQIIKLGKKLDQSLVQVNRLHLFFKRFIPTGSPRNSDKVDSTRVWWYSLRHSIRYKKSYFDVQNVMQKLMKLIQAQHFTYMKSMESQTSHFYEDKKY